MCKTKLSSEWNYGINSDLEGSAKGESLAFCMLPHSPASTLPIGGVAKTMAARPAWPLATWSIVAWTARAPWTCGTAPPMVGRRTSVARLPATPTSSNSAPIPMSIQIPRFPFTSTCCYSNGSPPTLEWDMSTTFDDETHTSDDLLEECQLRFNGDLSQDCLQQY